jgi:hypothetical protein
MFLKDGIHFPQASAISSLQNAPGNIHHQQQHPFPFHIGGHQHGVSLMDMAIDLLPHDFELVPFLQVCVQILCFGL